MRAIQPKALLREPVGTDRKCENDICLGTEGGDQKRGIGVGNRHHESWECERPKPPVRESRLPRIAKVAAARVLENLADAARPLELEYVILYDR